MEHLIDQTAITYPYATVNELTGETIKTILEDVADNLFNPDPYYQQGGDMVRVGGLQLRDRPDARRWASASRAWSSTASRSRRRRRTRSPAGRRCPRRRAAGGEPIWDVVARYLRARKIIKPRKLNVPLHGVTGNPGIA